MSTHTSFGRAGGVGAEGDMVPNSGLWRVWLIVLLLRRMVGVSEMFLAVGLRDFVSGCRGD